MSITIVLLGLVTGLALASIYILIAVSFTLILAASGVFNFVQGTVVMIGTILALVLGVNLGWPVLVTAAAICLAGAVAGILTHLIAVMPLLGRTKSFTHSTMLSTIGLGLAANAVAALLFGADAHPVPPYVSETPLLLGGLPLRPTYLLVILVGVSLTALIEVVVRRTVLGSVFRVTLEDPEGAQLLGINTRLVILLVFAVAGALSGIAGFLVAPIISASAFTAQEMAIYGFAAMAIGGFGSFLGALVGGGIVGILTGVLPAIATPQATLPVLWLVVVAILVIKPAGLCGTAGLFGSANLREV